MNIKALRPIVRFILRHIYGVRGGLKPPINVGCRNTRRYRITRRIWKAMDRLYNWSELPLDWLMWRNTPPTGVVSQEPDLGTWLGPVAVKTLEDYAKSRPPTTSAYTLARKELWAFFDYNHDLVLVESELDDIIDAVDRYRAAIEGPKTKPHPLMDCQQCGKFRGHGHVCNASGQRVGDSRYAEPPCSQVESKKEG